MRCSGFGFRVLGFGFRVSGSGFRVSGLTVATVSVVVSRKERERTDKICEEPEDGSSETPISERSVSSGTFVSSADTACPPSEYT